VVETGKEAPAIKHPSFPAHNTWKSWDQARAALADRLGEPTLETLDRTWAYAVSCHGPQRRPNDEPYGVHLLEVLEILLASGVRDPATLQAGLLHDVVEDTPHPLSEIRDRFGLEVGELVDWMTRPEPAAGQDPAEVRRVYLQRFKHAPPAATLLKLADRLSNVQRLHTHPRPTKRHTYYLETVREVVPCAQGHPWFEERFRQWREAFAELATPPPGPSPGA